MNVQVTVSHSVPHSFRFTRESSNRINKGAPALACLFNSTPIQCHPPLHRTCIRSLADAFGGSSDSLLDLSCTSLAPLDATPLARLNTLSLALLVPPLVHLRFTDTRT